MPGISWASPFESFRLSTAVSLLLCSTQATRSTVQWCSLQLSTRCAINTQTLTPAPFSFCGLRTSDEGAGSKTAQLSQRYPNAAGRDSCDCDCDCADADPRARGRGLAIDSGGCTERLETDHRSNGTTTVCRQTVRQITLSNCRITVRENATRRWLAVQQDSTPCSSSLPPTFFRDSPLYELPFHPPYCLACIESCALFLITSSHSKAH